MQAQSVNADQLYIIKKTECFSFTNGQTMQVAKLIKEDWPKLLKVLSLKHWSNADKGGIKFICVTMCSIVIGKKDDRIA